MVLLLHGLGNLAYYICYDTEILCRYFIASFELLLLIQSANACRFVSFDRFIRCCILFIDATIYRITFQSLVEIVIYSMVLPKYWAKWEAAVRFHGHYGYGGNRKFRFSLTISTRWKFCYSLAPIHTSRQRVCSRV